MPQNDYVFLKMSTSFVCHKYSFRYIKYTQQHFVCIPSSKFIEAWGYISSGAEDHAITWINAPELLKQDKNNHGNMDFRICWSNHVWGAGEKDGDCSEIRKTQVPWYFVKLSVFSLIQINCYCYAICLSDILNSSRSHGQLTDVYNGTFYRMIFF